MNVRRPKGLISLAAVVLGAGVVALVAWALLLPPRIVAADPPPLGSRGGASTMQPADRAAAEPLTLAALQRVCAAYRHQPLFDPTPEPAQNTVRPPARRALPPLRLMGIAFESGRSLAIIQLPTGGVEIRGAGETFEVAGRTVTVGAIGSERVLIEYGGKKITLVKPMETGAGAR